MSLQITLNRFFAVCIITPITQGSITILLVQVQRHIYCGACSSQPSLKRKLSISAGDGRTAKRFSKSNVSLRRGVQRSRDLADYGLQPCILVLPTEVIEKVIALVDNLDDLHSLTYVSRLFASIACHIYATRHGIHVTNTSCFIKIQGNSFRALVTWGRSRLFTCVQDKHLVCIFDGGDLKQAETQVKALRLFLSTPFVGRPFHAVAIHHADHLSPSEILQFIELIDRLGCRSATISSGLCNPGWFKPSPDQKLPYVSLSHLRLLDIDHHYLSTWQWSSLLLRLTAPGLEALFIRGRSTIHTLCKFISRHCDLRRLQFTPRWGKHTSCIKLSGLPQETLRMPLLSEIEGPPCYLQALLQCLSYVPDALTIKAGLDSRMTYQQYVRSVLGSVSLCGPGVHLEIHLTRYVLDHSVELDQKSLTATTFPQVASLEISFPSMSKRVLLVCFCLFMKCIYN